MNSDFNTGLYVAKLEQRINELEQHVIEIERALFNESEKENKRGEPINE